MTEKPTGSVFGDMGVFWAEIADKNQTSDQVQFLKRQLCDVGIVLDVACGTGRHSIPLTEAGFKVVGVDASRSLLKIAKDRNHNVAVVLGDMRFLPFKAGAFVSTISMDTSFGYLPSEAVDMQSLIELRRVLPMGGCFILDVFNREQLTRKYLHQVFSTRLKWAGLPLLLKLHSMRLLFWAFRWLSYSSFLLLQKRTVSYDGGWLCDLWVVYVRAEGRLLTFRHQVRLYGWGQLTELVDNAGFTIEAFFGDYELKPLSTDSARLILVSHAK